MVMRRNTAHLIGFLCVREPSTGLARVSLQNRIFTASQPPSPIPTACGQYSSASVHIYQTENGIELPLETI